MNLYRKHIVFGGGWGVVILLALALSWDGGPVQAQLVTVGFESITPGVSQADKQTGEEQLWLDVEHHPGALTATFKFYNKAPVGDPQPCSIADIYIQDGHLCSLLYIVDKDNPYPPPPPDNYGHPGVDFEIGATPGNLPDGQYAVPPFVATKRFSMDSDPPVQPCGINPDEWLVAVYSVQEGTTVYDIEQEILSGTLRVGYHVQAFSDGKSASFVSVPEPASILLLGLGGLALIKKRRI